MPRRTGTTTARRCIGFVPALILALAILTLPALAVELALDSVEGLNLVNVAAEPDALDGRKGLKLSAEPEVVYALAAKR